MKMRIFSNSLVIDADHIRDSEWVRSAQRRQKFKYAIKMLMNHLMNFIDFSGHGRDHQFNDRVKDSGKSTCKQKKKLEIDDLKAP